MATAGPTTDPFEKAIESFRKKLSNPGVYDQILISGSIEEVYKTTSKIQENLARKGHMRFLRKIEPFINSLRAYFDSFEIFVQVKPEILALIWGPLKLLLELSGQMTTALHKVEDALVKIGHNLPKFKLMADTFKASEVVRDALALFYGDILDFYQILFDFFQKPRWKQTFDIIWPRYQAKIDAVVDNLEQHTGLMKSEVTFLDIQKAQQARDLAAAHFGHTQDIQERQKYEYLKNCISPKFYDRHLHRLLERSVKNCDKWLLRDKDFSEWLDDSKNTVNWFWLHGMPGSGKTYLSAAVIESLKSQGRVSVLFNFISHSDKEYSLTALSAVQSLIFQAADENRDIKSLLVQTKERELWGSTRYAANTLKSILELSQTTYIIVDGLDEMDEHERQALMGHFIELSDHCDNLKILISSRHEYDIWKTLQVKTRSIRVDKRNSGSIQNYVDYRSEKWFDDKSFDPTVKLEIVGLLLPLSAKAQGMFLYARIILDNLGYMSSIEEIQSELKALPADLDEAYDRIFRHINAKSPTLRDKCRKILGWIGCSPVPISTVEMDQVLSIIPEQKQNSETTLPDYISTDYVQICGPIIEVVDGKLQFVHFTVHEYIFSYQVEAFINIGSSTERLVLALLHFLCSPVMEPDLDRIEIQENWLKGKYALLEYANNYWPFLLHEIYKNDRGPKSIHQMMERLLQRRNNDDFRPIPDRPTYLPISTPISVSIPKFHEKIQNIFRFHLAENRWDWNWENSSQSTSGFLNSSSEFWDNFDPLTSSQMLLRIQQQSEVLAKNTTWSQKLRLRYGSRLFKCKYLFCMYNRHGFETIDDRNDHLKLHGKPWKCTIPNCDWFVIGFNSIKGREDHWLHHHLLRPDQNQRTRDEFENLDPEEVQPLLYGLIMEKDSDAVKCLLHSRGGKKLKSNVLKAAQSFAAEKGLFSITRLLSPPDEIKPIHSNIVVSAIKSEDIEFVEWALSKAELIDYPGFMKAMLDTTSQKIYSLWENHNFELLRGGRLNDDDMLIDRLFRQSLFSSIKDDLLKEARVKSTLIKCRGFTSRGRLGKLLLRVSKSSCSLSLAKALLELGAPIDYPYSEYNKKPVLTPLHVAAKKMTKEAALLMECLVMNGARVKLQGETKGDIIDIGKEEGASNVGRFLGVTWDELLEERDRRIATSSQENGR